MMLLWFEQCAFERGGSGHGCNEMAAYAIRARHRRQASLRREGRSPPVGTQFRQVVVKVAGVCVEILEAPNCSGVDEKIDTTTTRRRPAWHARDMGNVATRAAAPIVWDQHHRRPTWQQGAAESVTSGHRVDVDVRRV